MKHYITEKDWATLEPMLMRMEIPYYVSFDSHVHEDMEHVTYDRYIRIEPVIIQTKEKIV
jgi:hypothetical protein